MMDYLDDRYSLDLMLVPSDINYLNQLKKKANPKKVTFIDPVPMKDIAKRINGYDIGLLFIPPTNFNYKNCVPNKLFEFIQARLAIALGPIQSSKDVILKYDLAIYSDSFNPHEMAEKVSRVSLESLKKLKQNACIASLDLNAENETEKLLILINSILVKNN